MIITFTNVIGAIRTAFSVVRSGLKMWLGFETSVANQEQVVDGDFPTGTTAWTLNTGWAIGNNKLNGTSAITENSQTIFASNTSRMLKITYDLVVDSGEVAVYMADKSKNFISQSGSYTDYITSEHTDIRIDGRDASPFTGSVTNVSVKELTQITPDKSGNNNVGELFTGKALELDGINDEINFGTAQIPVKTISFWIKPLSVSNEGLFYLGLSGFPQFRQISITSGNISATSYLTNFIPYVNNIQTSAVTQDVWQRVVLTFDEWTTTSLQIGKVYSSVYGHFAISDVQFYNETWSTDDIAYDYANPNKLAIDNPSTSLNVTNLKAYWALSEGDGLVAYDSGTNLEEEEVVNGDFATDSDWTEGTGWDIDVVNNKATCDGTQIANSNLSQVVYTPGKVYKTIITVDSVDAGSLAIFTGTSNSQLTITEADTYTIITEASTSDTIYIQANEFFEGSITNVSVREVTASDHGGLINGADYVLNQPRIPQLGMQNWSKGSNLLTYSEDFSEWNTTNTLTTGQLAPDGSNTATKITRNGTGIGLATYYVLTDARATNVRSIYAKTVSGTGTASILSFNTDPLRNITNDWQRFEVTNWGATGADNFYAVDFRGSGSLNEILLWAPQEEVGTSAGAYRLTDGGATLNSTVIANPTIPTKDIFGNLVRDRLNSFNLDGSGYAEVADDASINPTTEITVQCWIQSNTESDRGLVAKWKNPSPKDYMLYKTTSNFRFYIGTDIGTSGAIPTSGWVNIAGTYDGSNIKTYINGELSTTTARTGSIPNNSNTLDIGRYNEANGTPYSERISDVLLYDTALDANEIKNNYNAGLSAHTNN